MEQDQQNANSSLFQLNLDAQNNHTLRSAASWGKVLGVVGVLFGIICVIFGVIAINKVEKTYGGRFRRTDNSNAELGALVFIITGILYIVGSVFAINFGNKISAALRTNDQNSLNTGFAAARNYFAFWGVLLMIALMFCLLALVGLLTGNG